MAANRSSGLQDGLLYTLGSALHLVHPLALKHFMHVFTPNAHFSSPEVKGDKAGTSKAKSWVYGWLR